MYGATIVMMSRFESALSLVLRQRTSHFVVSFSELLQIWSGSAGLLTLHALKIVSAPSKWGRGEREDTLLKTAHGGSGGPRNPAWSLQNTSRMEMLRGHNFDEGMQRKFYLRTSYFFFFFSIVYSGVSKSGVLLDAVSWLKT